MLLLLQTPLYKRATGDQEPAAPAAGTYLLPAAGAAGVGAAGLVGNRQVGRINELMSAWDKGMEPHRQVAAAGRMGWGEAEKAIEQYAGSARQVAKHKILGVQAGDVVNMYRGAAGLPDRLALWLHDRGIWKQHQPAEQALRASVAGLRGAGEHYGLYTANHTTPQQLKVHHLHKALGSSHHAEWNNPAVWTPGAKAIVNAENIPLALKYRRLAAASPALGKMFEHAVLGNPANPWQPGEGARLSGNSRHVMSTPQVYGQSVRPIASSARRVLKGVGWGGLSMATAAGGLEAYRHFTASREKKAEEELQPSSLPTPAQAILGGSMLGGGGALAARGISKAVSPDRAIGVTYGEMPDIGEGHKAPGKAIAQALREDPRGKNWRIDELVRNRHGVFGPPKDPQHYSAVINTGFGSHTLPTSHNPAFDAVKSVHNVELPKGYSTEGTYGFQTDMAPSSQSRSVQRLHALRSRQRCASLWP